MSTVEWKSWVWKSDGVEQDVVWLNTIFSNEKSVPDYLIKMLEFKTSNYKLRERAKWIVNCNRQNYFLLETENFLLGSSTFFFKEII